MGFRSRSSKENHYQKGNYGSNHYQKKGLLGQLFNSFFSRSRSSGHFRNYGNPYPNVPVQNRPLENQQVLRCKTCKSQIPEGSKFCLECGEKVSDVVFCLNCGEKLPPNAKFCAQCGQRVNR